MAVELLIHTGDTFKALSGFVQTVKDDSILAVSPWGRKERLPNYAVIRLTDGMTSDVQGYLESWHNKITGTPLSINAGFRRFNLSVPNNTTTVFGLDKGSSDRVWDFLTNQRASTQISIVPDRSSAVFDLPEATFQSILDELGGEFGEQLSPRRFQIAPRDVSDAVTERGFLITTFAPIDARLIDRQA